MAKPGMIITGAAGFIGRYLVEAFQPRYEIFAIDRRLPLPEYGLDRPGVHWFQVDVCHLDGLGDVFKTARARCRVDFLLHLAGYYDFSGDEHREYSRSNVAGMRNVVELATLFNLKRLIFTSSVAACPFPQPGEAVTEETLPSAPPPYAKSKRAGEELLWAYQDRVRATVVRLAAVFTDWCEYPPLNHFLQTWFAGGWDARILGGKGEWAIPYIHMQDLVAFFIRIVDAVDELEPFEILQGSPNGATTHLELYREATRWYYGRPRAAIHMPKPLARTGIKLREQMGQLTGHMPFERSWMGDYIDRQLNVDASRTHRRLDWMLRPELGILARMPTIVQNMVDDPEEWERRWKRREESKPS